MENAQAKKLKVVIAGGGTAGWMTAAALAKLLGHHVSVTLVESEEIGIVGVGEATIPTMRSFHHLMGIDEAEFLRETSGTFKLGIQFENWGKNGDTYIHAFGDTGKECWAGQFQHFWLRGLKEGLNAPFGDYSPELQAAKAGKFSLTNKPRLSYAYHLDASAYARYLRKMSEQNGARRIEGKIQHVMLDPDNGFIQALCLESGEKVEGDLFIDCTGFRALLIGKTLHIGYEDWSNIFICDSAVAAQTELAGEISPYTRSIAYEFGWRWRIPLQHRMGNGLVYSSQYISDDEATALFLRELGETPINTPRIIKFKPGRRLKSWSKNCVAIGLSSGFIEPLESTSIHLISSSIIRLMRMIPISGINQHDIDEYNRQSLIDVNDVRDFVALHYKATERADSDFWRYCKNMEVPESLSRRMEIYRDSARIFWSSEELFTANSWNQVMLGQGILPKTYHPVADLMSSDELHRYLFGYRQTIQNFVHSLPAHADFLKTYCA